MVDSLLKEQPHPRWAKNAVFYQIFPERFANGDPSNDPPEIEVWDARPRGNSYFGGDLQGILDHLDYVRDLGANTVYLNPIFASPTNHKYSTSDYLKIDPAFGTKELFQKLIDRCHAQGMRIVIDGVFNHTGIDHWAFRDVVIHGAKSEYSGWYNFYSFPVALPPAKPNYECWWNIGRMPKLMVENPDVKAYLFQVTQQWTAMGIDGWRLDVPSEIPHEFWKEWRTLVKSLNPESYIVGEIWEEAAPWLQGDEFDAVMNYQLRDICLDFFCRESIPPSQFDRRLAHLRSLYPPATNYVLQNLIGSHDTERYLTLCGKEVWKVGLTAMFQMTYVGAPMVYYGDEIGMEGGKDPDCRRTMIWDEKRWNTRLHNLYKMLISIREQSDVLRSGEYRMLIADDERKMFSFERSLDSEAAYVFLNLDENEYAVDVWVNKEFHTCVDALSNETNVLTDGRLQSRIPGRSGKIFLGSTR